jgi:hypothetical protein
MNRSSSSRDSLSVGSIISAPETISGKADRVGVEAVVDQALGDVAGLDALACAWRLSLKTTSCIEAVL